MPQDHGPGPAASCRVASGRPGETVKNERDVTVLPEPTCDRRIPGRLSRAMDSPWWIAGLLGMLVVACFLWVPRSGRFVSTGGTGAAPLRRDEWAQSITYRSRLCSFIVLMLGTGAVMVYYGCLS